MPIPFLVPAGMMAVRIGSRWVLKKIAKRIARKKVLSKKSKKKASRQADTQEKKRLKDKTRPARLDSGVKRAHNRSTRGKNFAHMKVKKNERPITPGRASDPVNKKLKDALDSKTLSKANERLSEQEAIGMAKSRPGSFMHEVHKETFQDLRAEAKYFRAEAKRLKPEIKKELQKRKRKRQLKSDAKRRRN